MLDLYLSDCHKLFICHRLKLFSYVVVFWTFIVISSIHRPTECYLLLSISLALQGMGARGSERAVASVLVTRQTVRMETTAAPLDPIVSAKLHHSATSVSHGRLGNEL